MGKKYTIGIDYGTLSGRAVLISVEDGKEIGYKEYVYPHGVMDEVLPCGTKLGSDWALQHPADYLEVLTNTVPFLLSENRIDKNDVIGIGIDFTSCTILPIDKNGEPLCFMPHFAEKPNAYVKLWKHHAAQKYADMINRTAEKRGEKWMSSYGGKTSSEWAFAKILQVFYEDREIYDEADCFVEAGDWVVMKLCGKLYRSGCIAGFKAFWNNESGYPSCDFFEECAPGFGNVVKEKMKGEVVPVFSSCGNITKETAKLLGLSEKTKVSACLIDAHAAFPSLGGKNDGKMLMIMGTSTCHITLSEKLVTLKGICGVVKDGIMPGYYAYEAGQACVGDIFKWYADTCLPESYYAAANEKGIHILDYISSLAKEKKPGENRLIALDWWNGNRSPLSDSDLSGCIVGLTLRTKPEDIFRSLVEATAYGTRKIIENYAENGVKVKSLYATGGIAYKNPFIMQIYADVLGMDIRLASETNGAALGSAIFAAAAATEENGGYGSVEEASEHMGKVGEKVYHPIKENVLIYDHLYKEYDILSDYFGKGKNEVMHRLKQY